MAHWQFRPLNPNETSGSSISDDNFADEERTSTEILVRETLQNPLDARGDDGVVRVEYKLVTVELTSSGFAGSIFSDDWVKHFQAGGLIANGEPPSKMTFLVIEDFGTTGLEGAFKDSSCEGPTENWNAFWFREGEGAKTTKSNGGAGQGKITLYLASQLRSVFALTKRRSDGAELLFGCCRFKRNYKLANDGRRWAKEARWGAVSDPALLASPIVNPSMINAVKTELGLKRGSEAGTTFIIPSPTSEITEKQLLHAVANEFFFAISRGRLIVKVGDVTLDSSSIAMVATNMGNNCRLASSFREFLVMSATEVSGAATAVAKVSWNKEAKLNASDFQKSELDLLKASFERVELVSVDFPLQIKKKEPRETSSAMLRVFLKQDETAEHSHELFVRQDLGIDGEKRLKTARTIVPVMALTFIQDPKLSDLLVSAEEPTHRNWNARRPKVLAQYYSPKEVLNSVRNAALRLAQFLSPEGKKDEAALAAYFADPASDPAKRSSNGVPTTGAQNSGRIQPKEIPKPKPKPIVLKILDDGFEVRANTAQEFTFPIDCRITLAYATAVGNAFKLWDAADFWIGDESLHRRSSAGISSLTTSLNTMSFRLDDENSWISVSGFDKKRQLEIRAKYQEVVDGADNENN